MSTTLSCHGCSQSIKEHRVWNVALDTKELLLSVDIEAPLIKPSLRLFKGYFKPHLESSKNSGCLLESY